MRGAFTSARALANAARAPLGSGLDQARLGAALGRLAALPADRLLARPDRPVSETLGGGAYLLVRSRGCCVRCSSRC
ncbi:hypothetical protein SANT12839_030710 [Streptomyces antimycoticus]|nr:hypothetical protein SANT12839_030710 [Streptomyces antimycoticus]